MAKLTVNHQTVSRVMQDLLSQQGSQSNQSQPTEVMVEGKAVQNCYGKTWTVIKQSIRDKTPSKSDASCVRHCLTTTPRVRSKVVKKTPGSGSKTDADNTAGGIGNGSRVSKGMSGASSNGMGDSSGSGCMGGIDMGGTGGTGNTGGMIVSVDFLRRTIDCAAATGAQQAVQQLQQKQQQQQKRTLALTSGDNALVKEMKKSRKALTHAGTVQQQAVDILVANPPDSLKKEVIEKLLEQYIDDEKPVPEQWAPMLRAMSGNFTVMRAAAKLMKEDADNGVVSEQFMEIVKEEPTIISEAVQQLVKDWDEDMPDHIETHAAKLIQDDADNGLITETLMDKIVKHQAIVDAAIQRREEQPDEDKESEKASEEDDDEESEADSEEA